MDVHQNSNICLNYIVLFFQFTDSVLDKTIVLLHVVRSSLILAFHFNSEFISQVGGPGILLNIITSNEIV